MKYIKCDNIYSPQNAALVCSALMCESVPHTIICVYVYSTSSANRRAVTRVSGSMCELYVAKLTFEMRVPTFLGDRSRDHAIFNNLIMSKIKQVVVPSRAQYREALGE